MNQHVSPPVTDWVNDFDHTDPRWTEDPFPIWDELRAFAASPYHPSHTLGAARDFMQKCEGVKTALSDSKNEAG